MLNLNKFIHEMKEFVDEKKVLLILRNKKTYLWLSVIETKKGIRNQGCATAVMQELCKRCDEQKIKLCAFVQPLDHTTDEKRLMEFYEKFGFVKRFNKIVRYSR